MTTPPAQQPPDRQVPGEVAGKVVEDVEELDPGLARERTGLAWRRTNISLLVLGAAVLKVALVEGTALLALTVLTWAVGRRQVLAQPRPDARGSRTAVRLTAVLVFLVALAALAAALQE